MIYPTHRELSLVRDSGENHGTHLCSSRPNKRYPMDSLQ